jgi:hypothetical protein
MPLHPRQRYAVHYSESLTSARILDIFREEITAVGGTVTDTFHDQERLFTRSLLPRIAEVQRNDQVQAGVALRALGPEICLHPYVFRLVCRNGAIMAQAMQARHLCELHLHNSDEAESLIREAIQGCCVPEAFTNASQQMRSALQLQASNDLNWLVHSLSHLPQDASAPILRQIVDRFFREADRSRFGLMNAITSVARDTHDPALRWDLEELGGGIPAGIVRGPKKPATCMAQSRSELVGV